MKTNYTDKSTGITYFGIATYGDVNTASDTTIFPETLDLTRCLSKQIADNYSSNFNYSDDDPDQGKLLKFNSINFINTIPIEVYNNPRSCIVMLETCSIKFSENIKNTTLNEAFPAGGPEYIESGETKTFNIRDNRRLMPDPFLAEKSGQITLTIFITGLTLDQRLAVLTGKKVTCGFSYFKNNAWSSVVTPTTSVISNNRGTFVYSCSFNLSWIKSNIGSGHEMIETSLNTVWPNKTEKFKIQINAGIS